MLLPLFIVAAILVTNVLPAGIASYVAARWIRDVAPLASRGRVIVSGALSGAVASIAIGLFGVLVSEYSWLGLPLAVPGLLLGELMGEGPLVADSGVLNMAAYLIDTFQANGLVGVVAGAVVGLMYRGRSRTLPGMCRGCGYNLRGNVSGRCPECGREIGSV